MDEEIAVWEEKSLFHINMGILLFSIWIEMVFGALQKFVIMLMNYKVNCQLQII